MRNRSERVYDGEDGGEDDNGGRRWKNKERSHVKEREEQEGLGGGHR